MEFEMREDRDHLKDILDIQMKHLIEDAMQVLLVSKELLTEKTKKSIEEIVDKVAKTVYGEDLRAIIIVAAFLLMHVKKLILLEEDKEAFQEGNEE